MDRNLTRFAFSISILALLACPLLPTPKPTPEPTATWTPEPTATPVVIIVTATPAPMPMVDPHGLVLLPKEPERFAAQLVPLHGDDFAFFSRLGVSPDTIVYLFYEAPAGSGKGYLASYAIVGGQWILSDTVRVSEPTPTPLPAPTPGAFREARG